MARYGAASRRGTGPRSSRGMSTRCSCAPNCQATRPTSSAATSRRRSGAFRRLDLRSERQSSARPEVRLQARLARTVAPACVLLQGGAALARGGATERAGVAITIGTRYPYSTRSNIPSAGRRETCEPFSRTAPSAWVESRTECSASVGSSTISRLSPRFIAMRMHSPA
jgi:hypothetical protein